MADSLGRRSFVTRCAAATGALAIVLAPGVAFASGRVSVDARLSGAQVSVGSQVLLTVTVTEVDGDGSTPAPTFALGDDAPLDVIDTGGRSTRSMMSFSNGVGSSQRSWTYNYLVTANRPGSHTIPVGIDTESGRIEPDPVLTLKVTGAAVARPAGATPPRKQAKDDVFPWSWTDRERVYVGQAVRYGYDVWHRGASNVELGSRPSYPGFVTAELPVEGPRVTSLGGQSYTVQPILRRVLYPQRAGKLTIDGGEVFVTPLGPGGGLFGPPRRGKTRKVRGTPVTLEVLPLPAEDQPPQFSPNNVGQYRIAAEVDRTQVTVGDGLTLRVIIEGIGNIKALDPGAWPAIDGMDRYDPSTEFDDDPESAGLGGRREWKFLVIAQRAGTLEIPPHSLSYFDPETGEYLTVRSESITIEVAPSPAGDVEIAASASADAEDEGALAHVFAEPVLRRPPDRRLILSRATWNGGVTLAPVVLAVAWGIGQIRRRREAAAAARERRDARRRRHAMLAGARREVAHNPARFYAHAYELLQALALLRLGPSAEGCTRPQLTQRLDRAGVPADVVRRWSDAHEETERGRFGGIKASRAERDGLLGRLRELDALEIWSPPETANAADPLPHAGAASAATRAPQPGRIG